MNTAVKFPVIYICDYHTTQHIASVTLMVKQRYYKRNYGSDRRKDDNR